MSLNNVLINISGNFMTDSNEQQPPIIQTDKPSAIEEVLRDVYCPDCQYNLRGLLGNDVKCPECGRTCDIAELVSIQWTKPWYKAPYFNMLCLPLYFGILSIFVVPIVSIAISNFQTQQAMLLMSFAGWLACLHVPYRIFKSMFGVWLSLMLHGAFIGLMGGSFTIVICFVTIFVSPSYRPSQKDYTWLFVCLLLIAIGLLVIWLSRKAEKYVAQQCINQYLARIRGKLTTDTKLHD